MQQHQSEFTLVTMARVFAVSRSGYYEWLARAQAPSLRSQRQVQLDHQVAECFSARKGRAGSPMLTLDLADSGHVYDRKTVAKSMQRQRLRAKAARKFKATTQSNHNRPVAPNLLEQQFTTDQPNKVWVTDITYLATDEGWLYLAVMIDLYSRQVVGWAMSERMTSDLVVNALQMAIDRRRPRSELIVHSDRGSQYCSDAYQRLLKKHKLKCSMSGKGNCFDNACAESFFHTLKVELVHGERFKVRTELTSLVFEYIELYYNRTRRHSTLGCISPVAYEALNVA